jgi:hypothetical protein
MESREYNIEVETQFSREKLAAAIPARLQELLETIYGRKCNVEEWYANLFTKITISVARICQDLLDTMEKQALPAAAWNARNLLELWVWIKYCSASRTNAWQFHGDALRDMQGLTESLSKMHKTAGVKNEFEAGARQKLTEVAMANLGVNSLDSNFLRVGDAAKAIGLDTWYGPCNVFLSKYAHPTAGLVIGIMHQDEMIIKLQSACTTQGVFFAGQCVIALSEAISAFLTK